MMDSQSIQAWYDGFYEDSALAVEMQIDGDKVVLSVGSGHISLTYAPGTPIRCELGTEEDPFMGQIYEQLVTFVAANTVCDMVSVLQQFAIISGELAENMEEEDDEDGSDNENEYSYEGEDDEVIEYNKNEFDYLREKYPELSSHEEFSLKQRLKDKEGIIRAAKLAQEEVEAVGKGQNAAMKIAAKSVQTMFSEDGTVKILTADLIDLIKNAQSNGYSVKAIDDNIYHWSVKIYDFPADSALASDLTLLDSTHNYDYVEIEMEFAMDLYPMYPPLVKLVRPRFDGFVLGKIATLPSLQLSNWSVTSGVKNCIDEIRVDLQKNGRLSESPLNSLIHESAYLKLEHLLLRLGLTVEVTPRITKEYAKQKKIEERAKKKKEEKEKEEKEKALDQSTVTSSADGEKEAAVVDASDSMVTENQEDTTTSTEPSKFASYFPEEHQNRNKKKAAQRGTSSGTVWAAGTGYGSGHSGGSGWDINAYQQQQKEKDRLEIALLSEIMEELRAKPYIQQSLQSVMGVADADLKADTDDGIDSDEETKNDRAQRLQDLEMVDNLATIKAMIAESCLLPYLQRFLLNDSMTEITKHALIYARAFEILELIVLIEPMHDLLLLPLDARPGERKELNLDESCTRLAMSLKSYCSSGLGDGTSSISNNNNNSKDTGVLPAVTGKRKSPDVVHDAAAYALQVKTLRQQFTEDGDEDKMFLYMEYVVSAAKACAQIVATKIAEQEIDARPLLTHQDSTGSTCSNTSTGGLKSGGDEIGELEKKKLEAHYKTEMKELQFAESEKFPQYHYHDKLNTRANNGNRQRLRRLGTEQADLPHSLPLSWDATVWVRRLEDRMDALQFMISGPVDTPYMNGLFLFDTYFTEEYPNKPPLVNLSTTGKGSVRFNPNLYNNGKVCLSLLGTWSGQQGESWSAGTSTFLQVLLSIQSLIMIDTPYFNEPGYERGTTAATEASFHYNVVIMIACIKEAMIDQIRNPKKGFEEVTRKHFKMKRNAIIAQIEGWCQLLLDHREVADKGGVRQSYAPKQDLPQKEREMRGLLDTFTSITADL